MLGPAGEGEGGPTPWMAKACRQPSTRHGEPAGRVLLGFLAISHLLGNMRCRCLVGGSFSMDLGKVDSKRKVREKRSPSLEVVCVWRVSV